MDRRKFLHRAVGATLAGWSLPQIAGFGSALAADPPLPVLAVAHGPSPAEITKAAIAAIGGIDRFVHRGDRVVVKPNIGWDRTPEQAATTNPEVVAALIRLCLDAGAKSVLVMDNPCNDPRRCYLRSGIAEASKSAGAEVRFFEEERTRKMLIRGEMLQEWPVHPAIVEADVRINVPIAKHHGLTGVTLGMKNWLGALGGPRNRLHQEIDRAIVDLASFFQPQLTVIDGVRVLMRGGPQGGSLEDVQRLDTVIASADAVAAERRGATLYGRRPDETPHIAMAEERNLGRGSWREEEEIRVEVPAS